MSKLTVNVPTAAAGRSAVARQTIQIALNRSVPAALEESDRPMYIYPTQSKNPRMAPTAISGTNEFGTNKATPRGNGSREPAGTKIVDFGRNVELQPRKKFNVRGVGPDGFFPPVKLRTGTSGVRFSTSAGSVRSCKSAQHKTPPTPAASPLMNVELAPAKTPKAATGSESNSAGGSEDWIMPSARSENMARTHMLQDRPANPYNTRAVLAASRETFSLKESSPSPSQKAFQSAGNFAGQRASSHQHDQPRSSGKSDAAWVRSFKVKQRRHNRVKEILESKPAGLAVGSPAQQTDSFR